MYQISRIAFPSPCASSSFSSLPPPDKRLFLFLPLLLLAKKAVFLLRIESKVPVSPGHFLYFPVFLPRLLLGPVNYNEGEGHEIRAEPLSRHEYRDLCQFSRSRFFDSFEKYKGNQVRRENRKEARDEFELYFYYRLLEREREREEIVSAIF